MTKQEAKKRICGVVAATLMADQGQAGYLYEDDSLTEADVKRMEEAIEELIGEMARRAT
jgi:hypothetical protein